MASNNRPPAGVLIAVAVIIGMIIGYFIITMFFPDLFQSLSTGDAQPVPKD